MSSESKYFEKLEFILILCDQLVHSWTDEAKKNLLLHQLFNELADLTEFKDIKNATKLAELTRLKGTINDVSKVHHILVPVERELGQEKVETEFLVTANDLIEKPFEPFPVVAVIENIRSAFNVGSIIRSAECYNLEKVYLTGYTADTENEKLKKSTLGSENYIACESVTNILDVIESLKNLGYKLIGIETAKQATALSQLSHKGSVAVFFGNERFGLSKEVLEHMDEIVTIPLYGQKNSLNVSVCAGIVFNHLAQQCSL